MGSFNVTNVLSTVLVLAGLTRMIGAELHNRPLVQFASSLSFCPAPNPFRTVQRRKATNINRGLAFGCENAEGAVSWHRYDYRMRNAVAGPHRRSVVFLHMAERVGNAHLAVAPDLKEYLQYAWCNDGPLAEAAECGPDVKAFLLRIGGTKKQKRFTCR